MRKHTILFLAANPLGTDRVALDQEARAIHAELERSGQRRRFRLVTRWATQPLDLLRELRKLKPTVVHFSGHGTRTSVHQHASEKPGCRDIASTTEAETDLQHGLFFEGPDGQPQVVTSTALQQTVGVAGSSVVLVVLNACYSEDHARALVTHVDCVVGMAGAINDDAAKSFAIGFYGGLGEKESVAAAYHQGCAAISLHGLPDKNRPKLKTRDGVDASRIVLASKPPAITRNDDTEPIEADPKFSQRRAKTRCVIVIEANIDDFDAKVLSNALTILRKLTGDLHLSITDVDRGSVRLTVTLTHAAARRLTELRTSGHFNDLCGFRVGSVVRVPLEVASVLWWRRSIVKWAASGAIAIATVVILIAIISRPKSSSCETAIRSGNTTPGIEICLRSFEATGDERDLYWAAKGNLYLGNLDGAAKLATRMLHGPLSGDAHGILSYVSMRRGSLDDARTHALLAHDAHARSADEGGLARDAVLLSQIAWRAGDFTAALEAADDALKRAPALHDAHTEVVAYMARADALRRMGDVRGATATLTRAIERATEPCDKAWTRVKYGMCLSEGGDDGLAMIELTAAAEANRRCGSRDIWVQVTINQASLLRWKDPAGALAKLDEVTKAEGNEVTTLLLRGYLAADRGMLAEADRYLAQTEELEPPDADWPWEIVRARAELRELRGGWFGDLLAEYHYRRATAMVAALRATARARSAYLVSSHRGPYDDLIALLAREGRWRDVLAVVLELDASDMLRATADERVVRDRASPDPGKPAPRSIATPVLAVDDVLSAWRSRDLVIVITPSRRQIGPGHEQAYRLRIHDGQVTGEAVGDAGLARRWADDLFADPGDRDAAKVLGRMIVPPGPPDGALHVLAIGSLGKVPLAALRDTDGSLIVGRRPLVRVLSLHASRPEGAGAGPAVVIADPLGDLDRAAAEGSVAARALGSGVQVSGSGAERPATRSQLWAAHDAAVLHIAGHVGVRGRWRALRLADGDVEPAEIVQHGLAPRIAVLAGCGSAAAMDEEGWGSITAALLEAGTAVVIATDRSVRDDVALAVIRDFYAQPDWRIDPAHALASVQQSLDVRAATSSDEVTRARSWAAFFVLGRPPVTGAPAAPPAERQ